MTGGRPLQDTTVFVTGARGFMGAAVADHCRGLGATVRGVDVTAEPERGVCAGDIADPDTWWSHLDGSDLVIHTAAVVTNNVDPAAAWNVNVIGTQRVLDAATSAGASRFVHVSTMGVARFAQQEVEAVERYYPGRDLDERWPLMPVGNPYTDTKIAAEHLVLAAHAAGRTNCTIVRPADVYGPGCRPWVIEPLAAIEAGRFLLPAHGQGLFTIVYVDDLVAGLVAAATSSLAAGRIIHLGGDQPVTTAEYFGYFYRMLGRDGPPRAYSTRVAVAVAEATRLGYRVAGRPTELGRGVMEMLAKTRPVSNDLAHDLLGWHPQVSLAEGMDRTEAWLREVGLLPARPPGRP